MTSLGIGFAGMTHLGLISAVGAAEKGFRVICYDPDVARIEQLKAGKLFVVEPFLPEFLQKNAARLFFTSNLLDLKKCDCVYIAPDIPTNDAGESDLGSIRQLIDCVYSSLKREAILILLSQVPPGFTRTLTWGKKQLFYQVETLIFGQAMERTLKPERFIIGCLDPKIPLPSQFLEILQAYGCPILPMRYESAELSKIAINLFLISSVTTTNLLAELCEKIGADWSEIVPSLQLDKRIGKDAYLAPGLGIAGGNLERDMTTFCALSDLHGSDSSVVRSWKANSSYRSHWVLKKIHEHIFPKNKNPLFGILGLSYKKNTSSIKNSPAIALISRLRNFSMRVFDPVIKSLPDCYAEIQSVASALEVCKGADALLIMTPWDEFRALSPKDIANVLKGDTVIDPYGIVDSAACRQEGLIHFRLGDNHVETP